MTAMKKIFFSLVLVLLLALCLSPAALAEDVQLGTVKLGQSVYIYMDVLPQGSAFELSAYPPGDLYVTRIAQPGGTGLYLEGVANTPGLNYLSFYNRDTGETRTYYLNVSADAPSPGASGTAQAPSVAVSSDVVCFAGEHALLTAAAQSADGGALSYQWYFSPDISGYAAQLIPGATGPEYTPNTSAPGTAYYFCTVTGASASTNSPVITVTVMEAPTIVNLRLNSSPTRLTYRQGESVDLSGISLIAYMSNGDELLITNGFTYSPKLLDTAGQVNITVNYEGWLCSFPVTVTEDTLASLVVLSMPDRSTYTQGEMLNTSGLVLRAYTAGGGYKDIREGFTCTPTTLSAAGNQTITVSYKGQSCTFSVTVRELEQKLEISSTPVKLSYVKGDTLDTRGLVLRLSSGGTPQVVNSGFSCEPTVLNTVGTQTITVRYGQLTTSFTVTVSEPKATPTPSAAPSSPADESDATPGVSPTPRVISPQRRGPNKTFLLVVMFLAILTLVGLGAYLFHLNRKPSSGKKRYEDEYWDDYSPQRRDRQDSYRDDRRDRRR